jgi:hypothetical protein
MIVGGRRQNHLGAKTDQRDRMLRAMRTLDAKMLEVYSCTIQELLDACCKHVFEWGEETGFKIGHAAGRRAAKGKKDPPKSNGRPLEIDPDLLTLLLRHVEAREPRVTVEKAVSNFRSIMRKGHGVVSASDARHRTNSAANEIPFDLPAQRQATNAYFRHSRKIKAGS